MPEATAIYLHRYRLSYTFTDTITGDADAIRKEIRNLSFSTAFDPDDLNAWRVTRTTDGHTRSA